ncbi:hypothetical protein BcepSauron_292 [Burkholderia phage BcepSauron]|uniref:Uncharacterized protein n=1 Tax=Burkholderia phage BcepSauron TaxID=2530033 RepID=A0A482MN13_9CAUD|nr:hypothetical protein H1O17_gp292 [Burkholderia phage BcepSauron]QBQ74672.1 hypothetical protein BcepSauron_292 [Burkholderia phage BcepSauron]
MSTLNSALTSAAFVDNAAHRSLGGALADFIHTTASRSGFVRSLFEWIEFDKTNHTCPEYGRDEWTVARRILNRAKKRHAMINLTYTERLRCVLREIRRTKYQ